jgi:hypothetical protein
MTERKRQTSISSFLVATTATADDAVATAATTTTDVDPDNQDNITELTEAVDPNQAESSRCDISNNDIGLYVGKSVDDACKERLMKSVWIPDAAFRFPVEPKRRLKFQLKWFDRFTWVAYSQHLQGAFCKLCVLFGGITGGKGGHQALGALVCKPFNRWKDAIEVFQAHSESEYHKTSIVMADNFLKIAAGEKTDVLSKLDAERVRQIQQNRARLIPIIKTIIFCGRQELALRGTNEKGSVLQPDESSNDGNFRALLRFRIDAGDSLLKEHLNSSASNAVYTSPAIQNDIIGICGQVIQDELVRRVNSAKCFTVLADETTDIARTEQMSVCVRYIHMDTLREDFLDFVPVYDVRGRSLAETIVDTLKSRGINMQGLIGQGYDGAAAMSGHLNGVRTAIQEQYPMALYVHCAAHSLNLALSKSCSVPLVRNSLGTVREVAKFFRSSAQRSEVLKTKISEDIPTTRHSQLINMCDTRWVERHESMSRFIEMYIPIVHALEELEKSARTETSRQAHQLLNVITRGTFVLAVIVTEKFFAHTLPLCTALQKVNCDLAECCNFVKFVIEVFT